MTIKEIAIKKENEYKTRYIQWCEDNPGHIMNGLTYCVMGAEIAEYCETKEELEALYRIYHRRYRTATGVNGWRFFCVAFEDILNELP